MSDSDDDDVFEQEGFFHEAVVAAFKSGITVQKIDGYTYLMPCPLCQRNIEIIKRGRRLTFAGWEDACIQYMCEDCGFGGEKRL